jgi:hypothetical protein
VAGGAVAGWQGVQWQGVYWREFQWREMQWHREAVAAGAMAVGISGDQHERSGDVPGIALSRYVWEGDFQQVGRAQLAVCDSVAVLRERIAPLARRAQLGLELQRLSDRRLWNIEVRIDALLEKALATLEIGWGLVAKC